jgi:hypothetical protein
MAQKRTVIRVAAREPLKIQNITYDAYRLEMSLWGKDLRFWVDDAGNTLKEEGFMGLTTVKSSAAKAPEQIVGSGDIDFYELTAVSPDKTITKPRRVNNLRVRVEGLDGKKDLSWNWAGGRQTLQDGILQIKKEQGPFKAVYERPFKAGKGKMAALLQPEFNIESDDGRIREKAQEIAGDQADPYAAARKLMRWIYKNVDKKPVISVPSASEVLKTLQGDCNEHATLLAAFLRASGIPCRIVVGLVYSRGKFFYHAWNEAYIGRWITMDATLDQMPADATHIKLLEGNLDKQVELAGLIGDIEIKVLRYSHD